MTFTRRMFCSIGAGVLVPPALTCAGDRRRLRDIVGRDVDAPVRPTRILLGDGHLLLALSLLHPDPASLVVASQGDLKRHSPEIYAALDKTASRRLSSIAIVGEASPETFSVEAAIASQPDLAIFGGAYGPSAASTEVLERLASAGVPVVCVDFYRKPLENTAASMRLLGAAIGRPEAGEAFASFYETRVARVAERVRDLEERRKPSVFVHAFAGAWDCCWTPGSGGLGQFIALAGGRSLAADVFADRPWGQAGLEFVLSADPDVYIVTGTQSGAHNGGVSLGVGVSSQAAQATFNAALGRGPLRTLSAIQAKRAHAIWHLLHTLPLNLLAVELIATWLHPTLFTDIDPAETWRDIGVRFLGAPLVGAFFANAS